MAAIEVCLYDAVLGVHVPVRDGTAIRVHTCLPEMSVSGPIELGAMRPLAVYELLRRLLEHEGLSGMFVSQTHEGGATTFKRFGEEAPWDGADPSLDPRAHDGEQMRSIDEIGPCVELVLSGAEGLFDQSSRKTGPQPSFRDALKRYGHPALVVYLLSAHYSESLDDPQTGLSEARARVERIREVGATLLPEELTPPEMGHYLEEFRRGLGSNLDTRVAFCVLFEWLHEADLREEAIGDSDLREMLCLLELDELLESSSAE